MVNKLMSLTKRTKQITCRSRGNEPGLDLQQDLSLSRDGPVVRLLGQTAGKVVVSRGIVDMDLLLRTGMIRLVRIVIHLDSERGRRDMDTNLYFALLAGSAAAVRHTV
jgi:hypothetical protein